MRHIIIVSLIFICYLMYGCTADTSTSTQSTVDTLYIGEAAITYPNSVTLIFYQKGEYTLYDIVTGNELYRRYKDKSVFMGEGFDTVNITLPDTVVTFRYNYGTDETEVHTNTFNSGEYYFGADGWTVKEFD